MLTDSACRGAKPKKKLYRIKDAKGLYLEVKPNGVKAWRYRFELVHEGKRKESMFAIGEYAYVSGKENEEEAETRRNDRRFTLAEARKERDKARSLVKQGINPAHNRQLDRIKRNKNFPILLKWWLTSGLICGIGKKSPKTSARYAETGCLSAYRKTSHPSGHFAPHSRYSTKSGR